MAPLDQSNRQRGREVMEKSLTTEKRIMRRLSSGRPKKGAYERLTPVQMVCRLFDEADKAYRVLEDEGISKERLTWELRYFVPAERDQGAYVDSVEQQTMGAYGDVTRLGTTTKDAIQILTRLAELPNPLFTHIVWHLAGEAGWGEEPNPGAIWATRLIPLIPWKPGDNKTPEEQIALIEEELQK